MRLTLSRAVHRCVAISVPPPRCDEGGVATTIFIKLHLKAPVGIDHGLVGMQGNISHHVKGGKGVVCLSKATCMKSLIVNHTSRLTRFLEYNSVASPAGTDSRTPFLTSSSNCSFHTSSQCLGTDADVSHLGLGGCGVAHLPSWAAAHWMC